MTTKPCHQDNDNTTKKQVRFSNRNLMALVDNLSLGPEASTLWYSHEETDLFKAWLSHQVHKVRSQLGEHSALLDEELVTINAAAILGLEKYLSSELTAEYKNRRSTYNGPSSKSIDGNVPCRSPTLRDWS